MIFFNHREKVLLDNKVTFQIIFILFLWMRRKILKFFAGLVFIGVVHSHPQYKRYSISAENVPDTDGQKAPFYVGAPNVRDSKFVSVRPPESSGFGVIHGSVVKMRASSIVNLIFFVLSTNRQST